MRTRLLYVLQQHASSVICKEIPDEYLSHFGLGSQPLDVEELPVGSCAGINTLYGIAYDVLEHKIEEDSNEQRSLYTACLTSLLVLNGSDEFPLKIIVPLMSVWKDWNMLSS